MSESSHDLTFMQSQKLHRGIEENHTNSQTGFKFKAILEHFHYHLFHTFLKHNVEIQYKKDEIMGLILQTYTNM
jgi:hypothetical protein